VPGRGNIFIRNQITLGNLTRRTIIYDIYPILSIPINWRYIVFSSAKIYRAFQFLLVSMVWLLTVTDTIASSLRFHHYLSYINVATRGTNHSRVNPALVQLHCAVSALSSSKHLPRWRVAQDLWVSQSASEWMEAACPSVLLFWAWALSQPVRQWLEMGFHAYWHPHGFLTDHYRIFLISFHLWGQASCIYLKAWQACNEEVNSYTLKPGIPTEYLHKYLPLISFLLDILFTFQMLPLFLVSPPKIPCPFPPPHAQQLSHSCFLALAFPYTGAYNIHRTKGLSSHRTLTRSYAAGAMSPTMCFLCLVV
jgi:hypothetical protein